MSTKPKDKDKTAKKSQKSGKVDVAAGNGNGHDKESPQQDIAPSRSWGAIEDWFDNWPSPVFGRRWPDLRSRFSDVEGIRVEQYKEDDAIVVRAEIPGVDPDEDIEITVAGGTMTISAQRERREETKDNGSFRSEFHYGSFTRSMAVPASTSPDDVTAKYTDGVLEVRVPVDGAEEAKTKVAISRR